MSWMKFWKKKSGTEETPKITIEDLQKAVEDLTEEEILEWFSVLLDYVDISSEMVEDEELQIFTHNLLVIQCGDKFLMSDPNEFPWPLQFLPMPEIIATKDVH